ALFPWPAKLWRRRRRRRWAVAHGPAGRVAACYAELRDVAVDLNVGDAAATPLAFLDSVVPDEEHDELAGLVTRALWGDPARVLPAALGDYDVSDEASAAKAFASAGRTSMVDRGKVFTIRQAGAVQGALEIGVLKPRFDTHDIGVRRGVRGFVETGHYRW